MWSLPDIKRMNRIASEAERRRAIHRQKRKLLGDDGQPAKCQVHGCGRKAEHAEYWYDVFSNDPKGVEFMCAEHAEERGCLENSFKCSECGRVFVENYTWERYVHDHDDGRSLCLNCWRDECLAQDENWIDLSAKDREALTLNDLRAAPHLLCVDMDVPENLVRVGENVIVDTCDCRFVSGSMECLDSALREAAERGFKRAILIMDGAYQFCCSIQVYAEPACVSPEGQVCCSCGGTADLAYGPDPYAEEIEGNDTPVWECASCRHDSAMEI